LPHTARIAFHSEKGITETSRDKKNATSGERKGNKVQKRGSPRLLRVWGCIFLLNRGMILRRKKRVIVITRAVPSEAKAFLLKKRKEKRGPKQLKREKVSARSTTTKRCRSVTYARGEPRASGQSLDVLDEEVLGGASRQ